MRVQTIASKLPYVTCIAPAAAACQPWWASLYRPGFASAAFIALDRITPFRRPPTASLGQIQVPGPGPGQPEPEGGSLFFLPAMEALPRLHLARLTVRRGGGGGRRELRLRLPVPVSKVRPLARAPAYWHARAGADPLWQSGPPELQVDPWLNEHGQQLETTVPTGGRRHWQWVLVERVGRPLQVAQERSGPKLGSPEGTAAVPVIPQQREQRRPGCRIFY